MTDTTPPTPKFHIDLLASMSYTGGFTLWSYRSPDVSTMDLYSSGFFNAADRSVVAGDVILASVKNGAAFVYVIQVSGGKVVVEPVE